jgi:formylglycine-generating enzyme required for sulfatase activity
MRAKKANLAVRLFCVLVTLSVFSTTALAEKPVPPEWRGQLRKAGRDSIELIPEHERELVHLIREMILEKRREEPFENNKVSIPFDKFPHEMIAIKGGTFLMGSPDSEEGRIQDEGPQREVTVSDFWMGKTEVNWGQFFYFGFRDGQAIRNKNGTPRHPAEADDLVDWVSGPSEVYVSPDFGMGMSYEYPAIGMTQHSANKFCQWLSAKTGRFLRLPTEAEWEYACRAGTTGPWHCPADQIEDFAVIDPDVTRDRYEKVGTKKPNPWGLHDMHGNVFEWCLDGYSATAYKDLPATNPWNRATQRYPRVARGGSWFDDARPARSAARLPSHPDWNMQDPELPQSVWWLTETQWLGFRIVRPREIPSEEDMFEAWNTGAMHYEEGDEIPEAEDQQ